jgi:hypothetical protein
MKDKEGILDGSIKFYFAGQSHPAVLEKISTDVTNQKTNAVGKSDEEACKWVYLSALVQLHEGQGAGRQCRGQHRELLQEERDGQRHQVRMPRRYHHGWRRAQG